MLPHFLDQLVEVWSLRLCWTLRHVAITLLSNDTVRVVCLCRYLPVYVLPALLVHRGRLLNPATAGDIWYKVARGVARSSLFLAMYCTLAWRGVAALSILPQSRFFCKHHKTAHLVLEPALPALITLSQ